MMFVGQWQSQQFALQQKFDGCSYQQFKQTFQKQSSVLLYVQVDLRFKGIYDKFSQRICKRKGRKHY